LCAYGITTTGAPVFLGLDGVNAESTDAVLGFLRDLSGRGLRPPLLTITDGAPGLIAAVDQAYPQSLRQRCLIHRLGNLLTRVAAADHDQVRVEYWRIFDDIDVPPGQAAVDQASRRAEAFASRWRTRYPRMVDALLDQLGSLTAHLRFPRDHWKRIRHTNLIERTFGESRRRVKVIGRLPGEHTCLALVWAVLDRASRGWRGLDMNPANVRHLQQLRADLHHPAVVVEQMIDLPEPVTPAAQHQQEPTLQTPFNHSWDATLVPSWVRYLTTSISTTTSSTSGARAPGPAQSRPAGAHRRRSTATSAPASGIPGHPWKRSGSAARAARHLRASRRCSNAGQSKRGSATSTPTSSATPSRTPGSRAAAQRAT